MWPHARQMMTRVAVQIHFSQLMCCSLLTLSHFSSSHSHLFIRQCRSNRFSFLFMEFVNVISGFVLFVLACHVNATLQIIMRNIWATARQFFFVSSLIDNHWLIYTFSSFFFHSQMFSWECVNKLEIKIKKKKQIVLMIWKKKWCERHIDNSTSIVCTQVKWTADENNNDTLKINLSPNENSKWNDMICNRGSRHVRNNQYRSISD